MAINLELSNNQNLTLATIYCPNGNPNFSLFQSINNVSTDVMFAGDFNSKLESFDATVKDPSGPMLKNIQKQRPGGHSMVKNTGGGWLDSLGSGILVGKRYFGVLKNIGLDNS